MTPTSTFLSVYAALRFTSGQKSPGVITPLIKAFLLIVVLAIYAPVVFAIWLYRQLSIAANHSKVRPTTHNGYPARFTDHVNDLQEEMK